MTFSLKLRYKSSSLELNSGNYQIMNRRMPGVFTSPVLANNQDLIGQISQGRTARNVRFKLLVQVRGTSKAVIDGRVNRMIYLLSQGDRINPTYLDFQNNIAIPSKPTFGQFARTLQVVHSHGSNFSTKHLITTLNANAVEVELDIQVLPVWTGQRQLALTATGGVNQSWEGMFEGFSRGVTVGPAITNKYTNPVFGNSTPLTGWTTNAGLISETITDKEYVLFGKTAVRITKIASSSTIFHQSLNLGNTNTHTISFFAKKHDSSAVTTSNVNVHYNGVDNSPIIVNYGNGWYRVHAVVTAVNSSVATGVRMNGSIGEALYVQGFQAEEYSRMDGPTPFCYGDRIGCSWSGTEHASTSTRTVGTLTRDVDELFSLSQGTIRMVFMAPVTYNEYNNAIGLFDWGVTSIRLLFDPTVPAWTFSDGTNTVQDSTSPNAEFSAGDIIVLHATYGPNGIKLGVNGSVTETSNFTPSGISSLTLNIGTAAAAAVYHCNGPILDFVIWDDEATSAEIDADYNNVKDSYGQESYQISLPYIHTKDGDDQIDAVHDTSNENFWLIEGVTGNRACNAIFDISTSVVNGTHYLVRSQYPYREHFDIRNTGSLAAQYYHDWQGTATGNTSGGEYLLLNMSSAQTQESDIALPEIFSGNVHYFARFRTASGTVNYSLEPTVTSAQNATTYGREIEVQGFSSFRVRYAGTLNLEPLQKVFDDQDFELEVGIRFTDNNSSKTNIHLDTVVVINGDVLKFENPTSTNIRFVIKDKQVSSNSGVVAYNRYFPTEGDAIKLIPQQRNIVWCFSELNGTSETVTMNQLFIIPSWEMPT